MIQPYTLSAMWRVADCETLEQLQDFERSLDGRGIPMRRWPPQLVEAYTARWAELKRQNTGKAA